MKLSAPIFPLGFALFLSLTALGQASPSLTSGADFLLASPGARPAGLGQAFTALGDDIHALQFNPAGLAQIQVPEIGYDRYQFVSDISYDFFGAVLPVNTIGVFALGFMDAGTPPFNSTPDPNAPLVSASDVAILTAYARAVGPFQLGGTLKFIVRQIGDVQGTGILGDVGVRYEFQPHWILAASFQNLGGIQILDQDTAIPAQGRLGLDWKCLSVPSHNLDLAAEADEDLNSQSLRLGFGAEYWYQALFALRAGYVANSQEEGPAVGVGVRVSDFQLDYAYEPFNTLGSTHRLSLLARLGSGGDAETPMPAHLQTNPSNDGTLLTWDPPSFIEIKGYTVYVKRPGTRAFVPLTAHPINDTSVDLKHLKIGLDYEFGVATVNSSGVESPMNRLAVIAQEPVLSVPTGFKGEVTNKGIQLTWDEVDPEWVPGFNLYLADEDGNPGRKLNREPLTENQITLAKLKHNKTYGFFLTGISKDGQEGPPTAVLTIQYPDLLKK